MTAEPIVDITDLAFSYPTRDIFKQVNLTIARGQVVGIMGGSGSGKSTLLRLIGGQLQPSRGVCRVMGQDVHQLGHDELYELRRKIGMQFQQNGLFTDLSVFDNLAFPMREKTELSESQIQDLVLLKLNAVGLRGAADLMPSELSGA